MHKYSLVFQPDPKTIDWVAQLKTDLAQKIGWFNSRNALAHITICEFQTTEQDIARFLKQINRCCERFAPLEIQLNALNTYPNGALFLEVDPEAKAILKDYAQQLFEALSYKNMYKNTDPHLSIARKLTAEKIEAAYHLFEKPKHAFLCSTIALRKLNLERKQYDIIQTFNFLNLGENRNLQLPLF